MKIKMITTDDLRRMKEKEGLIIMGCGGDLQEWVDGMNDVLAKAGILLNDTQFDNVSAFQYGDTTCLLLPFENATLNYGKLALWRLQTHANFGGTWLSDFVPNRLGGYISSEVEKPNCQLIGKDGNIFNLIGIAARTLRQHGQAEQAKEMTRRIYASGSYHEALCIIGKYVNIISVDDAERKPSVREHLKNRETVSSALGSTDTQRKKQEKQER